MTPEIEPRRRHDVEAEATMDEYRAETVKELADLARLIDRADAEASRLRQARLRAWQDARVAGLSWRAIAAASGGMDHAQIAKTVNGLREGTD